jgi:hypothetical protein
LLDAPEQNPKRLRLPLALVFDEAPKPSEQFTVYVPAAHDNWDELEKTAQFILATDDQEMLQKLLVENGKGELDYREFEVQVGFPILYLGNNIFMLPKKLLNPRFEHEASSIMELNYGFGEGRTEPWEWEEYKKKKAVRDNQHDTARSAALKPAKAPFSKKEP